MNMEQNKHKNTPAGSTAGEVIDLVAGHLLRSKVCSKQIESILLFQEGEHEALEQTYSPNDTQNKQKNSSGCRGPMTIQVSLVELAHSCPRLVEETVRSPRILLRHYERAALVAQHYMKAKHPKREDMAVKADVRVRIYGIPGSNCNRSTRTAASFTQSTVGLDSGVSSVSPRISEIRASLAGRLICISGTIVKCGSPRLVEYKQQFQCGRCKHRFTVDIDIDAGGHVQLPEICPNNRRQRSRNSRGSAASLSSQENESRCQGTNFHKCEDVLYHRDYQEIRVQELIKNCTSSNTGLNSNSDAGRAGSSPKSITIVLESDLVDQFRPGEDVQITGILTQRWHKMGRIDMFCDTELLVNAVHVMSVRKNASLLGGTSEVKPVSDMNTWVADYWSHYGANGSHLLGRNAIVCSLCPQMHGLFIAKLAVMLVLCGGVAIVPDKGFEDCGEDSNKKDHAVRGECHLLLAGDPGTGKSQLMRAAAQLNDRSVVTNGRGSTNAGLTATAVVSKGSNDNTKSWQSSGSSAGKMGARSEWTLEAGALVLADGGICCIDEFETMREADRAAIHEAMEQQTLSIAKAGLVTKLRAQTAIIASTNIKKSTKKRGFDPFSVTFDESMVDISAPLLSRFDLVLVARDFSMKEWDSVIADHVLDLHGCEHAGQRTADTTDMESMLPQELLKKYIAHVRELEPSMTSEAEELLKFYYQKQRQFASSEVHNRPSSRTTIRMLESLVRLSQAHARLMAREQVLTQDAVVAITLMEASMKTSLILGVQNVTQSKPPENPEADYAKAEQMIMMALGKSKAIGYGTADPLDPGPKMIAPDRKFESRGAWSQQSPNSSPLKRFKDFDVKLEGEENVPPPFDPRNM